MSDLQGKFVIKRASESRCEFWTGSGWTENEAAARQYTAEPSAGEESGDESAVVELIANRDFSLPHQAEYRD